MYVLVEARDNGSLLRDEHRKALMQFIKQIQSNITIQYESRRYGFKELCEPYCELNTAFMAFLRLYDPNNQITFTYPSIDLFGSQIFIGGVFVFMILLFAKIHCWNTIIYVFQRNISFYIEISRKYYFLKMESMIFKNMKHVKTLIERLNRGISSVANFFASTQTVINE